MFPFCYWNVIYLKSNYCKKLKFQTVVGQEMVAINDLRIPINMNILVEL